MHQNKAAPPAQVGALGEVGLVVVTVSAEATAC
jgi:hypothetical protein